MVVEMSFVKVGGNDYLVFVKTAVFGRKKRKADTVQRLSGGFKGGNQREQGFTAHDKIPYR